jgi:hypothetical protein
LTRLVTLDVGVIAHDLRAAKASFSFVSPGVTSLPESVLGFTKGIQVRDPDGHALQVIQR